MLSVTTAGQVTPCRDTSDQPCSDRGARTSAMCWLIVKSQMRSGDAGGGKHVRKGRVVWRAAAWSSAVPSAASMTTKLCPVMRRRLRTSCTCFIYCLFYFYTPA